MRWLFKAEAITDLRYVPVGMLEQRLSFGNDAIEYMLRSRFAGCFLDCPVKMVHMHRQLLGKIIGRAQGKPLRGRLDGKLPFEQFRKYGRDPLLWH